MFAIFARYEKRDKQYEGKAGSDELSAICRLGSLFDFHGDLFIESGAGSPDWLFLLHARGGGLVHAGLDGDCGRPLDTCPEVVCPKVAVADLAREDMAECVEDAFKYGKIVLATTTYTNDIFPFMKDFIHHLTGRNYQNRTIGLIENGTWNPMANKVMESMFESSKNITILPTKVTIKIAMKEDTIVALEKLAEEIL